MRIGLIGYGKAGTNLTKWWQALGHEVWIHDPYALKDQSLDLKKVMTCEWVFIAVPDDAISGLVDPLKTNLHPKLHLGHVSGATSLKVFEDLRGLKAVFGLHPIRAFASKDDDVALFDKTYFGYQGSATTLSALQVLLTLSHDQVVMIPPNGQGLYHAAAVMTSNYLVTWLELCAGLYKQLGLNDAQAEKVTLALAQTAMGNMQERGLTQALTGPLLRGDVTTIEKHLQALDSPFSDYYKLLGRATIDYIHRNHPTHHTPALEDLLKE